MGSIGVVLVRKRGYRLVILFNIIIYIYINTYCLALCNDVAVRWILVHNFSFFCHFTTVAVVVDRKTNRRNAAVYKQARIKTKKNYSRRDFQGASTPTAHVMFIVFTYLITCIGFTIMYFFFIPSTIRENLGKTRIFTQFTGFFVIFNFCCCCNAV